MQSSLGSLHSFIHLIKKLPASMELQILSQYSKHPATGLCYSLVCWSIVKFTSGYMHLSMYHHLDQLKSCNSINIFKFTYMWTSNL